MTIAFTRKSTSLPCLAALALLLSACTSPLFESLTNTSGEVAEPSTPEIAPAKPPPSPVLAFVAGATPSASAQVNDPAFGGLVSVTIEADYHSASDKECRRFEVRSPSAAVGSRLHYACITGSEWVLVELGKLAP